mgnify:CR=1 FL=1
MITDPMVKKDPEIERLAIFISNVIMDYDWKTPEKVYSLLEQYYKDLQEHN